MWLADASRRWILTNDGFRIFLYAVEPCRTEPVDPDDRVWDVEAEGPTTTGSGLGRLQTVNMDDLQTADAEYLVVDFGVRTLFRAAPVPAEDRTVEIACVS